MTTVRCLPETDLARIALLPDDEKRIHLRRVKFGTPPYSYTPLRKAAPGLFNARKTLLDLPACTLDDIETAIRKDCRGHANWLEPNLSLAKVLFEFNTERDLIAIEREFAPVPIGFGAKLKLWHDFYTVQGDLPIFCLIDPRLKDGLTSLGRQFAFSVMHHNLALGDFSEARFEILRFPRNEDLKTRYVQIYAFDAAEVVSQELINQAIDATYKIWIEVLTEREDEARRHPLTGTGGLFDV